ncbi:hypothetical protein HPB49_025510 [Dermacentor silvarum]|uniref:Uncharacterized protein n=1 Tax=Dermacentor silvarum TaxID=543639 RepID=A0ACB8CU31_DERSI|nr:hypothetical protein HPB49_025510 [Dermacentor silvarum]
MRIARFRALISHILDVKPCIRLVVSVVLPRQMSFRKCWWALTARELETSNREARETNAILKAQCHKNGCRHMHRTHELSGMLKANGVHPTQRGSQQLADVLNEQGPVVKAVDQEWWRKQVTRPAATPPKLSKCKEALEGAEHPASTAGCAAPYTKLNGDGPPAWRRRPPLPRVQLVENDACFQCCSVLDGHHADSDRDGWTPSQPCRLSAPAAFNRATRCSSYGSFTTADHLTPILSGCFNSAIASAITLGRTKCTELVTKVLGPTFQEKLLKDLAGVRYSLIIDERSCTKELAVVLACNEAIDVLPTHIDYLVRETFNWFADSPKRQQEYKETYATINAGHFPNKLIGNFVEDSIVPSLESEYRLLQTTISNIAEGVESITKLWASIRNAKNSAGNSMFPLLSELALSLLALPLSNAAVERVFSQVSLTKNDLRNRMSNVTLQALLHVKFGLAESGDCCKDFQPDEQFLTRFNSAVLYGPSGSGN